MWNTFHWNIEDGSSPPQTKGNLDPDGPLSRLGSLRHIHCSTVKTRTRSSRNGRGQERGPRGERGILVRSGRDDLLPWYTPSVSDRHRGLVHSLRSVLTDSTGPLVLMDDWMSTHSLLFTDNKGRRFTPARTSSFVYVHRRIPPRVPLGPLGRGQIRLPGPKCVTERRALTHSSTLK